MDWTNARFMLFFPLLEVSGEQRAGSILRSSLGIFCPVKR